MSYRQWRADVEVAFQEEPPHIEEVFGAFVDQGLVTSKNSTDAYLAAFAAAGGFRLVTFDGDFERFPGLDLLKL